MHACVRIADQRKSRRIRGVIAVVVLAFVSPLLVAQAPQVIVSPGVGLADVSIGMSSSDVVSNWQGGQPVVRRIGVQTGGTPREFILLFYESQGVLFVCSPERPYALQAIVIGNPAFMVRGSLIHVGSHVTDIYRSYGKDTITVSAAGSVGLTTLTGAPASGFSLYSHESLGISFVVHDGTGRVGSIAVTSGPARFTIIGSGGSWSNLLFRN